MYDELYSLLTLIALLILGGATAVIAIIAIGIVITMMTED